VRFNSDFNMMPHNKSFRLRYHHDWVTQKNEKPPRFAEARSLFAKPATLFHYARDRGLQGLYPKNP
jgi:hypothetical protein